jgi:hypothetical protein
MAFQSFLLNAGLLPQTLCLLIGGMLHSLEPK